MKHKRKTSFGGISHTGSIAVWRRHHIERGTLSISTSAPGKGLSAPLRTRSTPWRGLAQQLVEGPRVKLGRKQTRSSRRRRLE